MLRLVFSAKKFATLSFEMGLLTYLHVRYLQRARLF